MRVVKRGWARCMSPVRWFHCQPERVSHVPSLSVRPALLRAGQAARRSMTMCGSMGAGTAESRPDRAGVAALHSGAGPGRPGGFRPGRSEPECAARTAAAAAAREPAPAGAGDILGLRQRPTGGAGTGWGTPRPEQAPARWVRRPDAEESAVRSDRVGRSDLCAAARLLMIINKLMKLPCTGPWVSPRDRVGRG